ncbi:MAG: hypothetical protein FD142_3163 [bacterium]|nr:MAG: hypothetical protein FD142_3163 [bacterium]
MNSNEIKLLLERYVPRTYTIGVYPRDQLPTRPARRSCLVVNSDPAGEPGHHWLALYVDEDIEFFDSFGQHPSAYSLNLPTALRVLHYPIQSLNSDSCGDHCIIFLWRRARRFSLTRIRSCYSRNHPANDLAATRQVAKLASRLNTTTPAAPCECMQCCERRCLCK